MNLSMPIDNFKLHLTDPFPGLGSTDCGHIFPMPVVCELQEAAWLLVVPTCKISTRKGKKGLVVRTRKFNNYST
jgi:hypothetical protein